MGALFTVDKSTITGWTKKKKKEKKKRKTQNINANARFSVIQTGTKNLLYENEKYQTVSAGLFIVVSLI